MIRYWIVVNACRLMWHPKERIRINQDTVQWRCPCGEREYTETR